MRSVIVLMTGTVMAQMIAYLISPILTRIYSTEEMGDLGVYMRAVGFIAALATARYELSLPLPKNDSHSYLLYRLSLRIAGYILLACSFLGIGYLLTQPYDINQVMFISITLVSSFFLVLTNLGTNWAIRMKQFKKISYSKISNSFVSNSLRWIFGVFGFGSFGLLLASLIGFVISSLTFIKELFQLRKQHTHVISKKKTYALSKEYKEFPLVSLPHVLVDLGRDLLIATLIITFFSKDIFGSFSHSYTILKLPLVVIGSSIGQVFYNRCVELINKGENIAAIVRKTLITLLLAAIIPFGLIFFFGEPLFSFVFSAKWSDSGYFSEIMAVWFMFNFFNSTVSTIPMILKRQREYFFLGLVSTVMQLICFGILPFIMGTSKEAFIQILWIVSISQAIFLIIMTIMTVHYAKSGVKK